MRDQEARYDRIAEGYADWWSPVHRPATIGLLEEIEPAIEAAGGGARVLDIGCGTGALAGMIAVRWPSVRVTGVDISSGMLAIATRTLGALPDRAGDRVTLVRAPADTLPFDAGSFDVAVTAFVLQLVPSRRRAVREARRVLAPGGTLATVGWLAGGGTLDADDAYDEALVAAGLVPKPGRVRDDPDRPEGAAARLRHAGFAGVRARAGLVEHRFTPEGYLGFVERFADDNLFASLDATARARLEADLLARLRALPPGGLDLRLPIAYATGRRSRRT